MNYDGWRQERIRLREYIASLEGLENLTKYSKSEQLAYWINLYNALTVNLVLEYYPIKSIKEINDGKPWDLKVSKVAERALSLNEIEHDIIRKNFGEPRIHFAVNCAALSCPKLLNEAYVANKLDAQLDAQKEDFLKDEHKNLFEGSPVKVSRLFDWYRSDFGSLHKYLQAYLPDQPDAVQIGFMEYDWALNE